MENYRFEYSIFMLFKINIFLNISEKIWKILISKFHKISGNIFFSVLRGVI